jgi:exodeoxyribonuclease VII small subunit
METALTYEAAYTELEAIYQAISNDAVSVDELAEKVKRAAVLVDYCQTKLKNTEEEINKIVAGLGQYTKDY